MKNILFSLLLTLSSTGFAAPKIPDAAKYLSGRQLCEGVHQKMLVHEKGFYTSVPLDYKNPASGTTDIYAFFAGGVYDAALPTIIYFNGGPGQPSHWGLNIDGAKFNVLLMDQRGIACSRPATWAQYMDPNFYSSESIARDAATLREKLNLGVVSVYGVSYGTLPATIYGSLFPQNTRSVILEGIVFKADNELWSSSYRRQMIQAMVDSLPTKVREILQNVSAKFGVDPRWLHVLAADLMGSSEGLANLQQKLSDVTDEAYLNSFVKKLKEYFEEMMVEPHVLFLANDIPYYMITCQEMGMSTAGLSTQDIYVGGKLSPFPNTVDLEFCGKIKASSKMTYEASKYPVKAPVYYFQGDEDFQTPIPQARQHYAQVPQGKKTMLVMKHGGHNPNISGLRGETAAQLEMFTRAILGQEIPVSLIEEHNKENPETPWAIQDVR